MHRSDTYYLGEDDLIPRHRLVALLVTMVAALAAQSRPPARPAGKPASTDVELEKAIRDRFAKSKCAQDKFMVRVQGGVATLEGKTDVVQRKGAATRMARTAGARKVINNIQVSEVAREKASATLATGRRRAQIKRSDAQR
jgi:osmotically-inducible protein OsmY